MNKKLKSIFYVAVITACGLVAYNYANNLKEQANNLKEQTAVNESVLIETIEVSKVSVTESIDNTSPQRDNVVSKKEKIKKIPVIAGTSGGELDILDNDKRQVLEYAEALPPVPDTEYVKEHFTDFNSNGVRDDIEIEIVEEFGDDKEIVEMFFADARTQEYAIYLVENYLLDEEHLQKVMDNTEYLVRCSVDIYRDSEFHSESNNWLVAHHSIFDDYHNSEKRKQAKGVMKESLFGYSNVEINEQSCKDFYDETKQWQLI